jgi:hypothetical protein
MNRQALFASEPFLTESRPLWNDNRVWWVNCVALEAAWLPRAAQFEIPVLRSRRDAMLAALAEAW